MTPEPGALHAAHTLGDTVVCVPDDRIRGIVRLDGGVVMACIFCEIVGRTAAIMGST